MSRILLDNIELNFTRDEFAGYCQVDEESRFYDTIDEYIEIIKRVAKPKALLKWCSIDDIDGSKTTIEGIEFDSKLVAEKLKGIEKVFFVVATSGEEIKKTDEIDNEVLKDIFAGAILGYLKSYINNYLNENFNMKSVAILQPGSLPDWPIENNKALCNLIGQVEEIGIKLNKDGYMLPWTSYSGIIFTDETGYKNCILCKKFDCVGRQAPFDSKEYERIFGN